MVAGEREQGAAHCGCCAGFLQCGPQREACGNGNEDSEIEAAFRFGDRAAAQRDHCAGREKCSVQHRCQARSREPDHRDHESPCEARAACVAAALPRVVDEEEVARAFLAGNEGGTCLQQQHIAGLEADAAEIAAQRLAPPAYRKHDCVIAIPEPAVAKRAADRFAFLRYDSLDEAPLGNVLLDDRLR